MTFLKLNAISKRNEEGFALKDIRFELKQFQKLVIAGETGSGKSTLLKIIAGLSQADEGEVLFNNEKVKGPEEQLVPGHPQIAYLAQDFALAHSLRVEQVLDYANQLSDDDAHHLYRICQIDHLLKRKTNQLSGGEKQRIALTRLLITSPQLLLLDEPFSHLDSSHKTTLKQVIHSISNELKITCILVSHDPNDTLSWADKIFVIKDGELIQQGNPQKIYRAPVNEYVAALFGRYNLIDKKNAQLLLGKNKQLILRPEDFKITKSTSRSLKGKVKQQFYYGSHFITEVELENCILYVKTEDELKRDSLVRIALK